ncbi:MAG: hypothetical protein EA420_15940 [Candidatus Competibacteraceae bacterium]|nr:MAG: hypothetical protein EA420_15940 [Candidatus Competibacteraceae bacterium]
MKLSDASKIYLGAVEATKIYLGAGQVWSGAPSTPTTIGIQGGKNFGVGLYPFSLPSDYSELAGTTDPDSAQYGNYTYSDGSICCFVPAFYYRIGHFDSPRFAVYGLNACDIASVYDFSSELAANAQGYVLHRAFIDGGAVKSGFFIDKYINCQDTATGTTHGSSLSNGVPISLTAVTTYTRSSTMTGCAGQLPDAIVLAKARGAGWQCASAFQYSALALLSLAHGQAATGSAHCAWYDASLTTNFPKGCNNNALADVNDAGVTFTTAGDAGAASKPLAGSGSPFAKTTHNGQACGIADLNGTMWETTLGVTTYGSSATDGTQRTTGDPDVGKFWVLKSGVAVADLTSGWNGATDHWQSAANIDTLYDEVADGMWWAANAGAWTSYGDSATPGAQVFSDAASGAGYLRTSIGHPLDAGVSASGTNLMGQDGLYQYQRRNLALLSGGHWGNVSYAGVWARNWNFRRTTASINVGWRSSAYLD